MSLNSSQINEHFELVEGSVNQESPPFITKIEIAGLFEFRNFVWNLNSDVNVLVGQNGSGKSSLLRVLWACLEPNSSSIKAELESVTVEFVNGFFSKSQRKPLLESNTDNSYRCEIQTDANFVLSNFSKLRQAPVLKDLVNIEYLSTFDMQLMSKNELDKVGQQVKTQLDVELEKALDRFARFQLALSRRTAREFSKGSQEDFVKLTQENFAAVNIFESSLNDLFAHNGKSFAIDDEGGISIEEYGKAVELNQLSSGEKQLILILLRVINSSDKPTIFMLDEPEVSLHLSWQEKLISTIRNIHSQCQLVIVTHSPAIIMKGWGDKMVDIKEIMTISEPLESK